jgi:hypothetical protein
MLYTSVKERRVLCVLPKNKKYSRNTTKQKSTNKAMIHYCKPRFSNASTNNYNDISANNNVIPPYVNFVEKHHLQDHSKIRNSFFYVLCDHPEIKDITNKLSYNLVENTNGVIAFTSRHNLEFLRTYLHHPFHVIELSYNELEKYKATSNNNIHVIYNSYSDIKLQKTYFLFYNL